MSTHEFCSFVSHSTPSTLDYGFDGPACDHNVFYNFLAGNNQKARHEICLRKYKLSGGLYSVYGFEYKPGFDNAYITWINNGKAAWTLKAEAVGANSRTEIAARPVPQEPMYIIANLGISLNFGDIDFEHLTFPTVMRIDWIRVYQPSNAVNIGCDPADFPTKAYINEYIEAYTNPNLTTWHDDFKQTVPKNKLVDQC
ncbi:SKN1-domain-containing protein [Dendrothele bispora CBS 962.96]|uniref:SKN1-domain-containing protein n=1 Tax=Dendrothele bispora (strain CBS 962.96) TaxID=1314807 RepID=A0A4V4HBM6_DENBC|nr:SKN1-domain-containing protein [Dendrothele bispora CBS 962.96]